MRDSSGILKHPVTAMLDNFLPAGVSLVPPAWLWDWRLAALVIFISPFALTYLITLSLGLLTARNPGKGKLPPNIPYVLPFIGNLIPFVFNMCHFLDENRMRFGKYVPISVRVLSTNIHLVSGRDHMTALFRSSRDLGTAPSNILILENLFGSPKADRHVYENDDTGIHAEPLAGSRPIKPHNRIFHGLHRTIHANLAGPGLAEAATRLIDNLKLEVGDGSEISGESGHHGIGYDEWVEIDDLYAFVRNKIFIASTNALCGPHLLRLNPTYVSDFWEFDSYSPKLFKEMPRWMIPKAYEARDRLHVAVKKWHEFAREGYDWEMKNEVLWEEFFGSKAMRDRQVMFRAVEGMSADAIAAVDLGMIWAANANVVPLIGFSLLDILLRPDLFSRVQKEIESTFNGSLSLDMPKLQSLPLFNSIYCEELRIRSSVMVQRTAMFDNFTLGEGGEWRFPKGNMILGSSWHEARDPNVWNEGVPGSRENYHSVNDFWAERFLVYPSDPNSGPAKPQTAAASKKVRSGAAGEKDMGRGEPQFTTDSVVGSFIPYGGGSKICPGRFYAKQESLASLALILKAFEIELKSKDLPKPNMEYFGFGVVQPLGKFPARIRRRRV